MFYNWAQQNKNFLEELSINIPIWDTIWICRRKFVFTDSIPQKFRQIYENFVNLPCINKIYGPRERKWILGVSLMNGNFNVTNFLEKC